MRKEILFGFFLLSILIFSSSAKADTPITNCGNVGTGNYYLANDISIDFGNQCLSVSGNNIYINLMGHSVTMNQHNPAVTSLAVANANNVTIENGTPSNSQYEMSFSLWNVYNGIFQNLILIHGMETYSSHNLQFYNITFTDGWWGKSKWYLYGGDSCIIAENITNVGRVWWYNANHGSFSKIDSESIRWQNANNSYYCGDGYEDYAGGSNNTYVYRVDYSNCSSASNFIDFSSCNFFCSCSDWTSDVCYNGTHRTQTRTCNLDECNSTIQYIPDVSCSSTFCGEGIPSFMCFFLDPLFLEVLIAIMLAGYIGYIAKSKWAFAVSLAVILLILTLAGDFPLWMLIIFILIVGAIVYLLRKEGAEGEG